MLKFKTSKENYSGNERVTAIILLLIQFWESCTLSDAGNRIKLIRKKAERKTGGGADCSNKKQSQCRKYFLEAPKLTQNSKGQEQNLSWVPGARLRKMTKCHNPAIKGISFRARRRELESLWLWNGRPFRIPKVIFLFTKCIQHRGGSQHKLWKSTCWLQP